MAEEQEQPPPPSKKRYPEPPEFISCLSLFYEILKSVMGEKSKKEMSQMETLSAHISIPLFPWYHYLGGEEWGGEPFALK